MPRSLRAYARCIGLGPSFRVRNDFFGYATSPPWTATLVTEVLPTKLSLTQQLDRLHKPFFHLLVMNVSGINDAINAEMAQRIDCALQIARNIYARAGFGIARIRRIPTSSLFTGGNRTVKEIVDGFGVDSDEIEVFFLGSISSSDPNQITLGETPAFGDGLAIATTASGTSFSTSGRTLAHELGHFLLHGTVFKAVFEDDHRNKEPQNLMCQTGNAQQISPNVPDLVIGCFLDQGQRDAMRECDWIKKPCVSDWRSGPDEPSELPVSPDISDEERERMNRELTPIREP